MITDDDAREVLRLVREALNAVAHFAEDGEDKRAEIGAYTVGTVAKSLMIFDLFLTRSMSTRDIKVDGPRVVTLVSSSPGVEGVFLLSDGISTLRFAIPTPEDPEAVRLVEASVMVRARWDRIDDGFAKAVEFPAP